MSLKTKKKLIEEKKKSNEFIDVEKQEKFFFILHL